MIAQNNIEYTIQQKALSELNDNIEDDFNDIYARLELLTSMNINDNDVLSYSVSMYIRDIQDYLRVIELKIK